VQGDPAAAASDWKLSPGLLGHSSLSPNSGAKAGAGLRLVVLAEPPCALGGQTDHLGQAAGHQFEGAASSSGS